MTATCQNPSGGSSGCAVSLDSSNRLVGNVGTFPGGATQEVRVTATIPAGASGLLTNSASVAVSSGINDPNGANNTGPTVTTALLDAVNDTATLNAAAGGPVNVMGNDLLGTAAATTSTATVSLVSNGGLSGLSVSGGSLVVPASTPTSTYTVTYNLCSTQNTAICDTATATIIVVLLPDLKLVKSGPASAVLTGYDTEEPSAATGFGIKVTRGGSSNYLDSAADAGAGSLTTTGGAYGAGTLQINLGAVALNEAGNVCFQVRIW